MQINISVPNKAFTIHVLSASMVIIPWAANNLVVTTIILHRWWQLPLISHDWADPQLNFWVQLSYLKVVFLSSLQTNFGPKMKYSPNVHKFTVHYYDNTVSSIIPHAKLTPSNRNTTIKLLNH